MLCTKKKPYEQLKFIINYSASRPTSSGFNVDFLLLFASSPPGKRIAFSSDRKINPPVVIDTLIKVFSGSFPNIFHSFLGLSPFQDQTSTVQVGTLTESLESFLRIKSENNYNVLILWVPIYLKRFLPMEQI